MSESDMQEDLYCKVYMQTGISPETLKELLPDVVETWLHGMRIRSASMKVDFFSNSLRNAEATTFVEWPFYLEVEPATDATERDFYISSLALMLKNLRSAGVNVVPSCDFEEELESLAR